MLLLKMLFMKYATRSTLRRDLMLVEECRVCRPAPASGHPPAVRKPDILERSRDNTNRRWVLKRF